MPCPPAQASLHYAIVRGVERNKIVVDDIDWKDLYVYVIQK